MMLAEVADVVSDALDADEHAGLLALPLVAVPEERRADVADGQRAAVAIRPLADRIGIQTLFVFSGVACLLVALSWVLTPSVRRAEEGPPA